MPELPDVQVFKEYVDATSLHRKIDHADIERSRELKDVSASRLASTLRGSELASTRRHGKHLFIELDGPDGWLRLHFGMTGSVEAWSGEREVGENHVRLRLDFTDGSHLVYRCPRRFGKMGLVDSVEEFVAGRGLGPDPLENGFDLGRFRERLEGRSGTAKSTLMNQKVVAGLGNIYVDEILFQSAIDPTAAVSDLDADAVATLFRVMQRVLRRAVEARVDVDRMPRGWLLPRREEGRDCSRCDGTIRKTEVSGRSTYYCTGHQKG